ncbi:MAG: lysophospholipid acyltransferase family protein [Planctomycetota bacterium]|jgi:1-acyl-sn-glycerol-3-phosphate acyltransferase
MSFAEYRSRVQRCSALQAVIWWIFVRSTVRFVMWLVYRQRCLDRLRVPPSGPAIYVANHQSHFDPPIVGCLVGPFAALGRATLFDTQPWGWMLTQIGVIRLHRGRGDAAAMRAAINELNAGGRVLLFPEGQRCHDGAVDVFQSGMLVLVKRSGAPVVPVAIEGPFDVWPRARKYPRLRGRIMARVGHPIPARELLDAMRLELRRQLRDATGGAFPPPGPGDRACSTQ